MNAARTLGVPFGGQPGAWNAITDVPGVCVGATTLIAPDAPVRTGITAILPRGHAGLVQPVAAALVAFNGTGEFTQAHLVRERGVLEGPICLTGTHNVGTVYDAALHWLVAAHGHDPARWFIPAVAETWDGALHDANGRHLRTAHVDAAIEAAASGPVAQGNVGGGTGMRLYGFKGGTGSASRVVAEHAATVGVLVQANFGAPGELRILGRPFMPPSPAPAITSGRDGSIIGIVATDAPLAPGDLQRLARRAIIGMARTGTAGGEGSGDIFLAFSTAPSGTALTLADTPARWQALNPLFRAAADATEEAIINALCAAETMTGRDGLRVPAIDHALVRAAFAPHGSG